jgi:hypothetical protein
MVLYKIRFFMPIGNLRWPPLQEIDLTLDPKGKCTNAFFSETTNMIKAYLIIFIFEHFPIGFNVNQCPAVATILDFGSA